MKGKTSSFGILEEQFSKNQGKDDMFVYIEDKIGYCYFNSFYLYALRLI